jgi:diketogulonate reductase-like aldo/keto reductase
MKENIKEISYTIKLYNGQIIPSLGLGTFNVKDVGKIVFQAIKNGIRLIDGALRYMNEKEVGEGINRAINEGIVKREDLFIITKLWCGDKENPEEGIKKSLNDLNLSYVDAYLDHWPMQIFEWEGKNYSIPTHVFWKKMEDLVRKGYTKSIGVTNYNVQRLMDLLTYAEIKPVINQIEYHPYLVQDNLIKYCKENEIQVMAYGVLCKGFYVSKFHIEKNIDLLEEKIVKEIAHSYNSSSGIIALRFALSQDLITIFSTSNTNRIEDNFKSLKQKLKDEEISKLKSLNKDIRCNQSKQWPFFKGIDLFS